MRQRPFATYEEIAQEAIKATSQLWEADEEVSPTTDIQAPVESSPESTREMPPVRTYDPPESPREMIAVLIRETMERQSPPHPIAHWEELGRATVQVRQMIAAGDIDQGRLLEELGRLSRLELALDDAWSNYETIRVDLACKAAPFVIDAFRRDPIRELEDITQEALKAIKAMPPSDGAEPES